MRKINGIITAVIMVIFALHAVLGALNLMNVAPIITKYMAWTMAALIFVHAVFGTILSVKAVRVWRSTGAPYLRSNLLFWARRLSGFAILLFAVFHVMSFVSASDGVYILPYFSAFRLATQLLLTASIAVHVITNVKPVLITFGIRRLRPRAGDILFFVSIILVLAAAAFIIYYIRWNTI